MGAVANSAVSRTTNQPRRSRAPWFAMGGVLALGGVAALAFGSTRDGATEEAPSFAPETPPAPSASARAATKQYGLRIQPADAQVRVDGEKVTVGNGEIPIGGEPGEVREVELRVGQDSRRFTVAITQHGLVPDQLELAAERTVPPSKPQVDKAAQSLTQKAAPQRPALRKPAPKPAAETKPPEPAPAATKAKPKVETSTEEFN
jgi:hypothetical protein